METPCLKTARKKRLLFLISEDWYFWTHRRSLAIASKNSGYDVYVLTNTKEYREKILKEGFFVSSIKIDRCGFNPLRDIGTILKIYNLYRAIHPDIVHHVGIKPVLYGTIAAIFAGKIGVINAFAGLGHLFSEKGFKACFLRILVRLLFKYILRGNNRWVIFQNPEDKDVFEVSGISTPSADVLIRGMGVNLREFKYVKQPMGVPVIMFAGRMLWNKGVGDLVEASKILKQQDIMHNLVLVGIIDKANPKTISEEQILMWEREGVIEWWGKREEMADILSKASIVALPTTYGEGVPKILIEAASVGRPLVGNNVPGCREVIIDNENGLLVSPGDITALAEAIKTLIINPGLREKMGRRSRQLAEKDFPEDKVINQTLELYEKAVV